MAREEPSQKFETSLLGFRCWDLDKENHMLKAMSGPAWQPGVNYAVGCTHRSPDRNCHCGFNAYYDFDAASRSHYNTSGNIIGAFAGAGRFELHRDGFRSSEAQIIALLVKKKTSDTTRISERYEIPVFTKKQAFLDFVGSRRGVSRYSDVFGDTLFEFPNNRQANDDNPPKELGYFRSFQAGLYTNAPAAVFIIFMLGLITVMSEKSGSTETSGLFETIFSISFLMILPILATLFLFSFVFKTYKIKPAFVIAGTVVGLSALLFISIIAFSTENKLAKERLIEENTSVFSEQKNTVISLSALESRHYLENQTFTTFLPETEGLDKETNLYRYEKEPDARETFQLILSEDNQSFRLEAMVPSDLRSQNHDGVFSSEGNPDSVLFSCESELCEPIDLTDTAWVDRFNELADPSECVLDESQPLRQIGKNEYEFRFEC